MFRFGQAHRIVPLQAGFPPEGLNPTEVFNG